MVDLLKQIQAEAEAAVDRSAYFAELRRGLSALSGHGADPVDCVIWVPLERVVANDYNPNAVALNEMRLLHTSIMHDGITQPIVTFYDAERAVWVIVDGFHRYSTLKRNPELLERMGGEVPIVVIDKPLRERMASTVRHNRARGKHSIAGMGNLVFEMLDAGASDADICNEIGLSVDELLRLKHITGFAKLFESVEYRRSWETRNQIRMRKEWLDAHPDDCSP